MGRYYSGDIEGKFLVAIQSSDAADRFGSKGHPPSYLEYYFTSDHLEVLEQQLSLLESVYERVAKFFEARDGWTDEMAEAEGISRQDLSDYADYRLGNKIRKCIKKNNSCSFSAEL